MAKKKNFRIHIILECSLCRINLNKNFNIISRYISSKNKKNNINKLELLKYCNRCNEHTIHKEIK
jgi:large subunit ribosomal protein L33